MYTMTKLGRMVLKGVNRVHNIKIRLYGLESTGYTMIKLDQIVLKGVNWVHNVMLGLCEQCNRIQRSTQINGFLRFLRFNAKMA